MKNKFFSILVICTLWFSFSLKAQQGKDHAPIISTSTVVNKYTEVSTDIAAGTTTLSVSSATGFTVGDLIYIIQMQGASINARGGYSWEDPTSSYQVDATKPYGQVLNLNNCGNNEFAQISAVSGTTVTVDCNLKNNYTASGKVQVIRVPRYDSLSITSTGIITCPQWNGTTGGVVAIEVKGNTHNAGKIDASSLGFRGGNTHNGGGLFGVSNSGTNRPNYGAWKGEGVAGDTAFYRTLAGDFGLGAMGNGGGGGIENNSGGGGGANAGNVGRWQGYGVPDVTAASYISAWKLETPPIDTGHSSGGGRGGYTFSGATSTSDPRSKGPGDASWGGDKRYNRGGQGGQPFDYLSDLSGRLFLGGGGGAGDEDNGYSGSGGNGGGIIYFLSYGKIDGAGQIISNGANGVSTLTTITTFGGAPGGKDGAGGAGAGGTVIIQSTGTISLTNAVPISANGGNGGDQILNCTAHTKEAYGPGGGGGGGYIAASNVIANITVFGGVNGNCKQTGISQITNITQYFAPNGATSGGAGMVNSTISQLLTLTGISDTVCTGAPASLSVTATGTTPSGFSFEWYNYPDSIGGTSVATSSTYTLTAPSSAGTYTYYVGSCPGIYRIPVTLVVNGAGTLSVTATPTSVCSGSPTTLAATGGTTYTWSANAGSIQSNTVSVSPTINPTTYTVTSGSTGCIATGTISVAVTPAPTLTITASKDTLCSGAAISTTLTATGGAGTYTWSANALSATTPTVSVLPTSPTVYTVSNGSGLCTSHQTFTVNITATPTINITPSTTVVCKGATVTYTAAGATTYTWSANAGSVLTNTTSVSPVANDTYTVTGSILGCPATQTVSIVVDGGPIKADSSIVNASCGLSNAVYVLNSITGGTPADSINFNGTGFALVSFPDSIKNKAAGTYPIIIKDANSCTYNTLVTFTVSPAITNIVDSVTLASCSPGNNGAIAIDSIKGGTAPYQANMGSTTFTITTLPFSFSGLNPGNYTVSVKDSKGCSYQSPVINVGTINGITSASVTSTADTCSKHNGTISVTNINGGALPYTYSLNGGSPQPSATFSAEPTGFYTITVTDNNGCKYPQTDSIKKAGSIATPTVSASGPLTFCMGDSVKLVSSSTTGNVWSTGATTQTITVVASNTVSVLVTASNGCRDSSTKTIVSVNQPPPAPTVTSAVPYCLGTTASVLTATTQIGATVSWSQNGTPVSGAPTPSTASVGTTTYSVYQSTNNCPSPSSQIIVTVSQGPTSAPVVTSPLTYCLYQHVPTFTATPSTNLVWTDTHGDTLNPAAPSTSGVSTTTYYVQQIIGSCAGPKDSVKVTVVAGPNANFSTTPVNPVNEGEAVTFVTGQNTNYNYYWDFADPTSTNNTSTLGAPTHVYNSEGTFCAKLLVAQQVLPNLTCKDSTHFCINVVPSVNIVIPNVFSPNGDGVNEVFSIKTSGATALSCDIFDRWGVKLCSFSGLTGFWDGTEKGTKLAVDGTYFYVIQTTDVKGDDHKYNGFVQLVR